MLLKNDQQSVLTLPLTLKENFNIFSTYYITKMAEQQRDSTDFEVIRTVFYYCFGIIFLPIGTFFATKTFIFDGVLGLDNIPANVYSAIAAVVVLHIALIFFIYKAYSDSSQPKPQKQD